MKIPLPETLKSLMLEHGGSGAVAVNVNGKTAIIACCNEKDLPPKASATSCSFELCQQGLIRWVVEFLDPNGKYLTLDVLFDITQDGQRKKLTCLIRQNDWGLYFFENQTYYHIASRVYPVQLLDRIKIVELTKAAQKLPVCRLINETASGNRKLRPVDGKQKVHRL